MTDELGDTTTYAYDSDGHLTSTTDALGDVTQLRLQRRRPRDQHDRPAEPHDHVAYDADRRLTSTTDPLGDVTAYTYDANGNPLTTTDALGSVTTTHATT